MRDPRERAPRHPRTARERRAALWTIAAASVLASPRAVLGADGKELPKYGPEAVRLHLDHSYVREQQAPDFWALVPYYLPQDTDSSCSSASVAMLLNGLRADLALDSHEKLVTQAGLLEQAGDRAWKKAVVQGGDGVTLAQLGELIERSLEAYGLGGYEVEVIYTAEASQATLDRVRQALDANETSSRDFILVNFLQSTLTGDPEGAVGHIAPIGAYDRASQRALVLDPDRTWYEPYWVSDRTLVNAMSTRDGDAGRPRGFVWIRRKPEPATGTDR
jgi:hypothetical protein